MKKLNIKNIIKIISGKYKHTNIIVADIASLRPTPNRIRETLFNWLNNLWYQNFTDKKIIDLFAGSGALGFEALSRGASSVYMIENNKKTIHNLKNIKEKLNAESAHIIYTDATRYIKTIDISQIDLIMLDPPFESNYIENIVPYIYQKKTSKDLLLYVEYYKPIRYSGLFQTLYRSRAGKVYFSLLKKI